MMFDLIKKLNENGIKWEYVYSNRQLYIKYDDKLIPWYF